MSNFTKEDLEKLEKLCKIKCTSEEEPILLQGLKEILDFIEQLSEVDTEEVREFNFVSQHMQQNIIREDKVGELLDKKVFLDNAPEQYAQMVKVPTILKKD